MKKEKDIMQIIAEANKAVTTGIDERDIEHWVWIHIMGRAYKVPAGLTIMQAIHHIGRMSGRVLRCLRDHLPQTRLLSVKNRNGLPDEG
jgi:hypothetical protein